MTRIVITEFLETEAVDELGQCGPDAAHALALGEALGVGARDDDVVRAGREALRLFPERLAQHPLDAVAIDGAADTARDGQPQARALGRIGARLVLARERVKDEEAVAFRAPLAIDAIELRTPREPATARGA